MMINSNKTNNREQQQQIDDDGTTTTQTKNDDDDNHNNNNVYDDDNDNDDLTLFIGGSSCLGRTYVNLLLQQDSNNSCVYDDDGFFLNNNNNTHQHRRRRKEKRKRRRRLLLSGLEKIPPKWLTSSLLSQKSTTTTSSSSSSSSIIAGYIHIDLTNLTKDRVEQLFLDDGRYRYHYHKGGGRGRITNIIIGVRPILFAKYDQTEYCKSMIDGIQTLLECFCDDNNKQSLFVLHLSSVAAVDHMREQSFQSENDDDYHNSSSSSSSPSSTILEEYKSSYDIFKFRCEDMISSICNKSNNNIRYCHLRLGAIFSDDPNCIQCSALKLQSRVGCYLPNPIDCNSGRNVSCAISAILSKASSLSLSSSSIAAAEEEIMEEEEKRNCSKGGGRNNINYYPSLTAKNNSMHSLYYYTRPLQLKHPVPYGYYLEEYRNAYGINRYYNSIWIPVWIVTSFVSIFHWIASLSLFRTVKIPYIKSADYLLQVSSREHSFDNTRFAIDFGSIGFLRKEESILNCFIRRRRNYLLCSTKGKEAKSSFNNNVDKQNTKSL